VPCRLLELRHSAATHLGDQKVPLQLIMAKTRHKSPRTAMRYIKPGDAAVAEVTSLLGPAPAHPLSPAAASCSCPDRINCSALFFRLAGSP
jgi:hypothetical protein